MLNFVYPAFLWAGAALTVPLVLHLLRRPVSVHLVFPSIRFIRKGPLPHTGRRRLQDVLLLLLRLLMLAAVILAFAQPEWQSSGAKDAAATAEEEKQPAGGVFYVDASASMSGRDSFRKATDNINRILEQHAGAPFGLVVYGKEERVKVPPTAKHEKIRNALRNTSPSLFAGKHAAGLRQAVELLPGNGSPRLYIVSDFQQTDWQLQDPPELPPRAKLQFIDVFPESPSNAGIVRVSSTALPEGGLQLMAEVLNYGDQSTSRQIRLDVGRTVVEKKVELSPHERKRVNLTSREKLPSKGKVRLNDDDAYTPDDTYAAWLGQAPPIRILAVVPFNKEPSKENELFFVRKAFSVRNKYDPYQYRVEPVSAELFFSTDLSDYQGIVLMGAGGYLRDRGFKKIGNFLNNGGVVFSTPGRAATQQLLKLRRQKLLDIQHNGRQNVSVGGDAVYINQLNDDTVLADAFPDPHDTDLFLFPIRRYLRLAPSDEIDTLLKAGENMPILMSRSFKAGGKFYLSAVGFTPEWSDWPLSSSFLPVLRETFAPDRLKRYSPVKRINCGAQVALPQEADRSKKSGSEFLDTSEPAVEVVAEQPYEINVPRSESVLRQQSRIRLRKELSPQEGTSANVRGQAVQDVHREAAADTAALWPYCAMAAALLILGEMFFLTLGSANGGRQT